MIPVYSSMGFWFSPFVKLSILGDLRDFFPFSLGVSRHVNREYMKLRHFGGAYIALQLAGVSNSRLARQTVPLNFTDRAKAARAVLKAVETEAGLNFHSPPLSPSLLFKCHNKTLLSLGVLLKTEATSALLLGGRIRSTVKNLFLDVSSFSHFFRGFFPPFPPCENELTGSPLTPSPPPRPPSSTLDSNISPRQQSAWTRPSQSTS